MSSTVKNVFKVLVVAVVMLVVGAFLINILAPNAVNQVSNAVERQIYNATGISLDLNGDKVSGRDTEPVSANPRTDNSGTINGNGGGNTVTGFSRD